MLKSGFYLEGLTLLLILVVVAAGCNKEDDPPEFQKLSFNAEEVLAKLPAGLTGSSNPSARECIGHIESALDMSDFINSMEGPVDAQRSTKKSATEEDEWYWPWIHEGMDFTLYWTYNEDASVRYWSMDIEYGAGSRYDYIDAWESEDGGDGEVKYYFKWAYIFNGGPVENYEELFWKYTWLTDESGTYSYNWFYESGDPRYDYYIHYVLNVNPDSSGTIDYYSTDLLFYHADWDVSGNGSWRYYLGDIEQSGTWTVG